MSVDKYKKLRNFFFEIKNWIKLFLEKGSSIQCKGLFVSQKGTFLIPLIGSCFWHFYSNEKNFFFKMGTF